MQPIMSQTQFTIGIFNNAAQSIEYVDFGYFGLKLFKLEGEQFKAFILSISVEYAADHYYKMFYEFYQTRNSGSNPFLYALVPNDLNKPQPPDLYYWIERILLIMFPTDFKLLAVSVFEEGHFQEMRDDKKYEMSHIESYRNESLLWMRKSYKDGLLDFDVNKTSDINSFLKATYNNLPKMTYLDVAVDCYMSAFNQHSVSMAFINYCISLESLLKKNRKACDDESEGNSIGHQLRKTIAAINGHNAKQRKLIGNNVYKLYDIRSNIVHGGQHMGSSQNLFKLQALVSRTLIELISLQIYDRDSLETFVETPQRSKNYKQENFHQAAIDMILSKVEHEMFEEK